MVSPIDIQITKPLDLRSPSQQAQIHIGTPPVCYILDIDTGSSTSWFRGNIGSYLTISSSATHSESQEERIGFCDGDTVNLDLVRDTITLDPTTSTFELELGIAPVAAVFHTRGTGADGILALGLGGEYPERSLIRRLKEAGSIDHGAFSLVGWHQHSRSANWDSGELKHEAETQKNASIALIGRLVLGTSVNAIPTNKAAWFPLIDLSRWEISLDNFAIKKKYLPFGAQLQRALFDSGTSFMVTTAVNLELLRMALCMKEAPKQRPDGSLVLIVEKSSLLGSSFFFGGFEVILTIDDLIIGNVIDGKGILSIIGLPNLKPGQWILGTQFLANITTHFDLDGKRIGIERHP
ncbi:hypothetical protein PVAG01_09716 [Phlyctema vagabunda]|uniref:Peptidase A1 domain-containing protein n=1 Tax=Phlyctema vagabunda TaxID=108571 RepID=A0ABR4P861_9HELO